MLETALVFPILPGKRLALLEFVAELRRQQEAHDRMHTSITEERWFVHSVPQGDMLIVSLCGPDPALVFADLAVSEEPFGIWFRAQALDITGVDLTLLPPFELPECLFSRSRSHES